MNIYYRDVGVTYILVLICIPTFALYSSYLPSKPLLLFHRKQRWGEAHFTTLIVVFWCLSKYLDFQHSSPPTPFVIHFLISYYWLFVNHTFVFRWRTLALDKWYLRVESIKLLISAALSMRSRDSSNLPAGLSGTTNMRNLNLKKTHFLNTAPACFFLWNLFFLLLCVKMRQKMRVYWNCDNHSIIQHPAECGSLTLKKRLQYIVTYLVPTAGFVWL